MRRHFGYHADSKTRRDIHFMLELYYMKPFVFGAGSPQSFDCGRPAPSSEGFHIINVQV